MDDLKALLEDVYINGTRKLTGDSNIDYFRLLIYWSTLQEEINHPANGKRYWGRRLTFCRYAEVLSICCGELDKDIDEISYRANTYNERPSLYSELIGKYTFYYE